MGIVWIEISSEKKIFDQIRTKIHFWRTDLTIDFIIVVVLNVVLLGWSFLVSLCG